MAAVDRVVVVCGGGVALCAQERTSLVRGGPRADKLCSRVFVELSGKSARLSVIEHSSTGEEHSSITLQHSTRSASLKGGSEKYTCPDTRTSSPRRPIPGEISSLTSPEEASIGPVPSWSRG